MADESALHVHLHGEPAGELTRDPRGELRFRPVGMHPILSIGDTSGRPWNPAFTRAWFEGLLPEGPMRSTVAGRFAIDPADPFELLGAVGWECAGAVTVTPGGIEPSAADYGPLTNAEVADRLDALPAVPFEEDSELRASLGGQQDKLLLAWRDGRWHAARAGALTTHILKPEPDRWRGIADAEAWSLALVGSVTPAARALVDRSLGQRPVLIVERFDRPADGERIGRIHQEDACQVLGLLPSRKYSHAPGRPDDPSYGRIAASLRVHAVDAAAELRVLLRQMVAHVALMDTDAHGKNLSLLHEAGGFVRVSPVYDIVPTTAFLPGQRHLAMSVAGGYRIDQVTLGDLVAEAISWGYPADLARADVTATIATLGAAVAAADAAVPDLDPRIRLHVTGQLYRLARAD